MAFKTKRQARLYMRAWTKKNRAKRVAQAKLTTERRRVWFRELKAGLSCSRCGMSDPRCLQFHHVGTKRGEVSQLVARGISKERILAEIAVCVVLCANCHQIEHYHEIGT